NGQVRERAAALAAEAGVRIEHINKAHIRKEDVVARVLAQRGEHPGLVHIISAMEGCTSYRPRYDAETGRALLRPGTGKCLHYSKPRVSWDRATARLTRHGRRRPAIHALRCCNQQRRGWRP